MLKMQRYKTPSPSFPCGLTEGPILSSGSAKVRRQRKIFTLPSWRTVILSPPPISNTMAAAVNGGFASPLADASYTGSALSDGGLLSSVYNGMNGLNVCVSLFLVLVAYDQCESSSIQQSGEVECEAYPYTLCSQIYMEQGLNRRPVMENPLHWTLLGVDEPPDGEIH